jgi:phage protein U
VALLRFWKEIVGAEARILQRGVKRPLDVKARTEEAIIYVLESVETRRTTFEYQGKSECFDLRVKRNEYCLTFEAAK